MRVHTDERRTAYCAVFYEQAGDTNVFIVKPGQRTCWHRHQQQTDQFLVAAGSMRFGLIEPGDKPEFFDMPPSSYLRVDPNTWHGYENTGPTDAILVMYLSRPYDPSDEERMSEAEIPWGPFCDYCKGLSPCQCGTEHDY